MEDVESYSFLLPFFGAGAGTVLFQAFVPIVNEFFVRRNVRFSQGAYLAIRIAVLLEQFAYECAVLIQTNMRIANEGKVRQHESLDWQTVVPRKPEYPSDDLEGWRVLPPTLYSRVLDLRNRMSYTQSMIDYEAKESDLPRREIERYVSRLGLEAFDIAKALRGEFKIPDAVLDWDYSKDLMAAKTRVIEADNATPLI